MKREILIVAGSLVAAWILGAALLAAGWGQAGIWLLLLVLLAAVTASLIYYWRHDSQIKRLERIKTEFVSVASHQLRTPLTAMNWYLEMMLAGDTGKLSDQQKDYLEEVYRGSNRMVSLVNDLLNISRLESGKLRIKPAPTDLTALVKDIIKEVEPLTRAKNCDILFESSADRQEVALDARLVRQVIHNLITNAIKYTDGQKRNCYLAVKIEESSISYLVSVADNGIGIPAVVQPRIFEKFVRADNAIKVEAEGSGLGLYIARLIMEASGGSISFASQEGAGSKFTVTIPKTGMKEKAGEKSLAA